MNRCHQYQWYFRRRERLCAFHARLIEIAAGAGIVLAFAVARAAVELQHG
jgi:hypothetical protein